MRQLLPYKDEDCFWNFLGWRFLKHDRGWMIVDRRSVIRFEKYK